MWNKPKFDDGEIYIVRFNPHWWVWSVRVRGEPFRKNHIWYANIDFRPRGHTQDGSLYKWVDRKHTILCSVLAAGLRVDDVE